MKVEPIYNALNNFRYFNSKYINSQPKVILFSMSISAKIINVLLLSGVGLFFIGTFSIIFYFIIGFVIEIIISPLYPIIGWILFVIGGSFIVITPRKYYHTIKRGNKRPLEIELLIIGLCGLILCTSISIAVDIYIYRNDGVFPFRTLLFFTAGFVGFIIIKIRRKKK